MAAQSRRSIMTFLLALTIAGLTTQHNVSSLSFDYRQFTYTESGLWLCSGVTGFRFEAGTGAAVTAVRCVSDRIFPHHNGF